MAKRTMTEEQKKKAAESLAKARAAKKAKEEAAANAEVTSPAPAASGAIMGERNVVKELSDDSDEIPFIIPLDPSVASEIQWWERSINGHVLRLQRGKLYTLPRYLVNYIQSKISVRTVSDASTEAFTVGAGKHLNF